MEAKQVEKPRGAKSGTEEPTAHIIYYTDPLCCWSWAMTPQWLRLNHEKGEYFRVSYRMIGLLPSWDRFSDSVNSLSRPSQMGPEWMHAGQISGLPVAVDIWITDPPASSFPSCIAVKCAEAQSPAFGAEYLRAAREAVMVAGKDISLTNVLLEIAEQLSYTAPDFDFPRFSEDLLGGRGSELFKHDYREAQYLGIRRSPTLVMKSTEKAITLCGYQTWPTLQHALATVLGIGPQ